MKKKFVDPHIQQTQEIPGLGHPNSLWISLWRKSHDFPLTPIAAHGNPLVWFSMRGGFGSFLIHFSQ